MRVMGSLRKDVPETAAQMPKFSMQGRIFTCPSKHRASDCIL